ncbi:hypothetical protein C8Q74DRAFT_1205062 [Fomes fomentarius]|nr:hypothetical protein C8Q74DRAFT_1205062 [Fomes fomentarius]
MSSPVPPSPSLSAPRPLQLVDGNIQSPALSSCPSPTASGLSTPPPSAHTFNPRRQSSISYYPSDHTPTWDIRSPTTAGPSSLRRSASLNQNAPARLVLKGDRRSLPTSDVVVEDRPPLTLTEKHADLLRFIAQKESKCLELRSQLAAHEAELAQLKRKWERIVSRGMDRAYSQQPAHPGAASASLLSGAVKDVSRLLAAGLSDLSPPSPSPAPKQDSIPALPPLRTPVLRAGRTYGHANTQSTSSVSTSGTSATSASLTSSSVRLSQSSASSLAFDEPPYEQDEREEEHARESESPVQYKRRSVRVDGGTGIESPIEISPSSATKAAKLHRRKSREVPAPPSPLIASSTTPGSDVLHDEEEKKKTISKRSSLQIGANGLPPAASIPGLGPLASPLASTWMGSMGSSVGKKWEELQKGETFTKSQKRASLLISDAANSLFAALTSPSSSSSSTPTAAPARSPNSLGASFSSLASSTSASGPTPSPSISARSLLEDDDDAPALRGSVLVPDSIQTPLTPSPAAAKAHAKPAQKPSVATPNKVQSKSLLDDDDEWNW